MYSTKKIFNIFNLTKNISKTIPSSICVGKNNYTTRRQNESSSNDNNPQFKGLVIGIYEKEIPTDLPKLTISGEQFDGQVNGKILKSIEKADMTGKLYENKLFTDIHDEYRTIAIVGLGKEAAGYCEIECIDDDRENVRIASAIGAKKLDEHRCTEIYVDPMEYPEQAAEGSTLSIWKYQENLTKRREYEPKLKLFETTDDEQWNRGIIKATAQNYARRLNEMPANQLTPLKLAQEAVDSLCPCGISVEVRTHEWVEAQKMTAFEAIAKSSCQLPLFLEIKYCGTAAEEKPVVLIGQGLTFNSGGICLKKADGMSEYRASMAGAATVLSVFRAASSLSLPINLVGLIPICENMVSGLVSRPGDVITCLNGKTIAIQDTSEAGVLLLAESLIYAQNHCKPKLVIDVATLSKDMKNSLDGAASGVFTASQYLWNEIFKAGTVTGDRVWRMPLWNYFSDKVTKYPKFDVSNRGFGAAGACKSAAILREFIPCMDWVHIDMRGVGMLSDNDIFPYLQEGRMTGRPTRMLIQFLHQLAYPEQ